MDRIIYI